MTTPDLTFLSLPWELVGHTGNWSDVPAPTSKLDTDDCISPLLLSRDDKLIPVNGDERLPELFVEFQTRFGETRRVWDVPVPLYAREPQTWRFHTWDQAKTFYWGHGIDRPSITPVGDESDENQEEPDALIHRFLRTIRARMQDFETCLSDGLDPWSHVQKLWLGPKAPRDPTMDVLIQHERKYRTTWSDIAEHTRRLLTRKRELVALSRVQELDVQCMQWLSRQPGKTLAERAGGRQRIMAFARYENRNTLENRIFLDLMVRTGAAARDYLAMNHGRTGQSSSPGTSRIRLVEAYMRECSHIQMELILQGVLRQTGPVQPNYVLLYDQRYRQVWTAWQEIIQRERVADDLWRWQRRAWTEFCKAVIAVSLLWIYGAERFFAAPLLVTNEHLRGNWLIHDDPLIVVAHWEKGWAAELLSGNSDEVPKTQRELCASFWLRYADLNGGPYYYLAIWTIHSIGSKPSLSEIVDSANKGFRMLSDHGQLAGGIVLLSQIEALEKTKTERAEFITGCAFGPDDRQLIKALEYLSDDLRSRIEDSLCDR